MTRTYTGDCLWDGLIDCSNYSVCDVKVEIIVYTVIE